MERTRQALVACKERLELLDEEVGMRMYVYIRMYMRVHTCMHMENVDEETWMGVAMKQQRVALQLALSSFSAQLLSDSAILPFKQSPSDICA